MCGGACCLIGGASFVELGVALIPPFFVYFFKFVSSLGYDVILGMLLSLSIIHSVNDTKSMSTYQ